MFSEPRGVSLPPKPNLDKRLCSSRDKVDVYLLVNEKSKPSKKLKTKQNYIARIAVINPKDSFVGVHFWDVADNKATLKLTQPRKSRFEKRKTNYVRLGETKIGKLPDLHEIA